MTWLYLGHEVLPEELGKAIGFVYEITNLETGRRYIGKKNLTKAKTLKPLKGKVRKRRSRVESDWRTYYGSNDELKADVEKFGPDKFKREILRLCHTKGELSYMEAHYQFERQVLLKPDEFYNQWIKLTSNRSYLRGICL
jgi:hypothetical protein